MTPFTAELIGTAFLVLLGDGVVANVVLGRTKGNNAGWMVITGAGPGIMQAGVDGLPFLPGLLFAFGDVVGQLGPFEVEGQPHSSP